MGLEEPPGELHEPERGRLGPKPEPPKKKRPERLRVQMTLSEKETEAVYSLQGDMRTANNENDVLRLAVMLVHYLVDHTKQDYKIALVKGDEVQLLKLFI